MNAPSTTSEPEPIDDRSVGGILVHPLALFTAFVGPAVVYAVSGDEFTQENARQALNWHVTVVVLAAVAFPIAFLGADEATIGGESIDPPLLPAPLEPVFTVAGILLLLTTMVAVLLTFVYAIVATQKAIAGSVWSYPGAIDIVGRNR